MGEGEKERKNVKKRQNETVKQNVKDRGERDRERERQ